MTAPTTHTTQRGTPAIVVNTDSGGWRKRYLPLLHATPHASLELVRGPRLHRAIAEAIDRRPSRLIIAGGDGSLRTAAALAADTQTPLAFLPLGTMNLLARDLDIPLDFPAALNTAIHAPLQTIDAAYVNDRIFLHSSLLGVVPMLAHHRESWRVRSRTLARLTRLRRVARALLGATPLALTVESAGERLAHNTFCLAITNNTLLGAPGAAYARTSLQGGSLGIYRATHTGRLGLARLLAALGAGAWWLDPAFHAAHASDAIVYAQTTEITVSNDGELERLTSPLVYSIRPAALAIAAPPLPSPPAPSAPA